VLTIQPHKDQQVRLIQHRHETRFHRHPVNVFDARAQAVYLDLIADNNMLKIFYLNIFS